MSLKIKFLPYEVYKDKGFKRIFKDLRDNTLIVIDAKIKAEEEAEIIRKTMENISGNFSGIEISSLDLAEKVNGSASSVDKIKNTIVEKIIGKKRGMTIIGPAKIVRRIEKDPEELLVHM